MNSATLESHVVRQLESLEREFAGELSPGQVTAVGKARFDELRAEARVLDFIPALVYRDVRDEVLRRRRGQVAEVA